MSRNLSSTLINKFNDDQFYLATLIKMNRGGVQYRFTDYTSNLTYANQVYGSTSFLLEVGNATESQELRVNDMTITLSGVDQTFIQSFLSNNNYIADTVTIYRAVVNPNTNGIFGAIVYFEGRIAVYGIEESETDSKVAVTVASHWADFERVNGRKTNQNSQAIYFPNDTGFQYAAKVVKDLRWGRKA